LCYTVHSNVGQWTCQQGKRFPLYAEDLTVSKRQLAGNWAQLSTVTGEGSILVYETLNHERVRSIEYRLAVRSMPSRPFDWRSVVEETIVIERRLILKEEVQIRRRHVSERHQEAVLLRKQEALVTRIEPHNSEPQGEIDA
jgi:stress response protein YsnF